MNTQLKSAPPPPTSVAEWRAKRVTKRVPRINDEVEVVIDILWETPEFYQWFKSTWNDEAVEGSSRADQYKAAEDIREYARKNPGFPILAAAKLESIYKSVTWVRSKHDESIRQRRGTAALHGPMAPAEDGDNGDDSVE